MAKIIGIHGIFTNGKRNFCDRLFKHLTKTYNLQTSKPSYILLPLLGYFKFFRDLYVRIILKDFNDGDHIVAHSAGCTITLWTLQELAKTGRKAGHIWFLNAALDTDITFPSNTYIKIHNYHEPKDIIINFSNHLPKHPFGRMGRDGYNGYSANVFNYVNIVPRYQKSLLNHGSFFLSPAKEVIGEHISKTLLNS